MIKNTTKNTIIAKNPLIARSLWQRTSGLIVRKFIPDKMDGMIFERCSSLHTFFMFYKFDIIFVDKSKKVIKLYKSAAPWRIFSAGVSLFQSCTAIECPEQTIAASSTQIGDILDWNL